MFNGVLNKMKTEIDDNLNYFLELGDDFINVNQLLGSKIKLSLSESLFEYTVVAILLPS